MQTLEAWRDDALVQKLAAAIGATATRRWSLMEVCGGQTHNIVKYGLDQLLPDTVELVHGPGCPVCVTPAAVLETAMTLAARPEVIFCSFGDMLRVPAGDRDLLRVKAEGGGVRIVYSPLDAVALAHREPRRQVVFFAVGFETTAPVNALAVLRAAALGLDNFSLLVSQVRVPPVVEALLATPGCRLDGLLAAGHVCTVMGVEEYRPLAERHRLPIVVTGFEPVDILQGVLECLRLLEAGEAGVHIGYARAVRPEGNPRARALVEQVFEIADQPWRGLGVIPAGGLRLRPAYARFDAAQRFGLSDSGDEAPGPCIAGRILQGLAKPPECPAFGDRCTPERPLGAPMVSAEGACAAYYHFRRGATA